MKENQQFTIVDMFSVYFLVSVVIGVTAYVSQAKMVDWRDESALIDVHKFAKQLSSRRIAFIGEKIEADRSIASESLRISKNGTIGLDPWGQPYTYLSHIKEGDPRAVIVLSAGPNQRLDTTKEYLENFIAVRENTQLQPLGDDLIAVRKGL